MEELHFGFVGDQIGASAQVAEYNAGVNLIDEIDNFLLGKFDKSGKYKIDEGIVSELIALKKTYLYAFSDMIFCESQKEFDNFGKIQYVVKVEEQKDEMLAKLFVVQEIKRLEGALKKTAMTELLQYKEKKSPSFVNDCFVKFNIFSKTDEGHILKKTDETDILLTNRGKYLKQKQNLLDTQEEAFKVLVEKKLALLAKNKYGKKVIAEYNQKIAKVNLSKISKGYYKNLNSLLDQIVGQYKSLLLNETVFVSQWGKINSQFMGKIAKNVLEPTPETSEKPKSALEQSAPEQISKPKNAGSRTEVAKSPKIYNKGEIKIPSFIKTNNLTIENKDQKPSHITNIKNNINFSLGIEGEIKDKTFLEDEMIVDDSIIMKSKPASKVEAKTEIVLKETIVEMIH